MNQRQMLITAMLSCIFTLVILGGSLLIFSRAVAAPSAQSVDTAAQQGSDQKSYISVSALAFMPTQQASERYNRIFAQQLLTFTGEDHNFNENNNLLWAPLSLPDHSNITEMKIFGLDNDDQGKIQIYLVSCDHSGQTGCQRLAWAGSGDTWKGGAFETPRFDTNKRIDNSLYTYLLELRLTALGNKDIGLTQETF